MTPCQFYKTNDQETLELVAKNAGTSLANLRQISLFGGSVGKGLAERLAKASDYKMSELEILYPERYEDGQAA